MPLAQKLIVNNRTERSPSGRREGEWAGFNTASSSPFIRASSVTGLPVCGVGTTRPPCILLLPVLATIKRDPDVGLDLEFTRASFLSLGQAMLYHAGAYYLFASHLSGLGTARAPR